MILCSGAVVGAVEQSCVLCCSVPAAMTQSALLPVRFDHVLVYVCDSGCGGGRGAWQAALRRTQSAGCLVESVTAALRSARRDYLCARRGGRGGLRACASYNDVGSEGSVDLGRAGDMGGGTLGAGSSFNNLDCTDGVSPRVSTNSLASGLDNWGEGSEIDPACSEPRRVADPSPASLRRGGGGSAAIPTRAGLSRLQQHLGPRTPLGGAGDSAVARSPSCPSVTHLRRAHGLAPELQLGREACSGGAGLGGAGPGPRHDYGKSLQLGSVESDSFNVTTPTEESQGRVSPLSQGRVSPPMTGEDFQSEANRFIQSAATREASLQCPVDAGCRGGEDAVGAPHKGGAIVAGGAVGADVTEDSMAATAGHKAGRMSRSLARTKCLQWLSSLDEGD